MSTTKTKTELVRMGWVTALRTQGHRKCEGYYSQRVDGGIVQVCALGMLMEIEGTRWGHLKAIGALAGLSPQQTYRVVKMNDGRGLSRPRTFSEIADVVESWFKT